MPNLRLPSPSVRSLGAFLALALPSFGVQTPDVVSSADLAAYVKAGTESVSVSPAFDEDEETNVQGSRTGASLVIDFTSFVTESKPRVYVSEISVCNDGGTYSLATSEDGETRSDVADAQSVTTTGKATYRIGLRVLKVKYSFVRSTGADLKELTVMGWRTSKPTKISALNRSIFFRGGTATRGNAGFNGGHYSKQVFNGNFNDPAICNMSGVTELVIPTTAPDAYNTTTGTGTPWYVTEFKVAHQGNSKYSLYYTTDPEPADILENGSDPRTWTLITGASMVEEQSLGDAHKVFTVNKTATAVKYVFESFVSWTGSLAEVEVLAMDPDDLPCTHDNLDLATATYTICSPATCTENAREECVCPDCGQRFPREVPLSKLGHIYVATLTRVGRPDRYGSGFVSCSRTLEDPDTGETTWSCDFRIDFNGEDVDFTTLGGIPINGVIQYTDLTASSTAGLDGGVSPEDVMDNVWNDQWNGYWFAEGLSTNEYIQYQFGTTIELTKIEFSVHNLFQTVYFTKYDPATGEETILKAIPIERIQTFEDREDPETGEITRVETTPGYQRLMVDFFVYDKYKKTFLNAIRMRIGDYVDPVTGEITKYVGTQYGSPHHTTIIEFHPWGTIQWAGLMTHPPTTVMLLR
jgi:hypothetical protein